MKVLILTEGSPEIGFGHITRCTAIRQALMKVDPEIETKMVILSPGNAQKFLGDYLSDADIFDWHSSREQTKILAQKYDVVIVDSYLAPVSIYEMLSQQLDGKLFMIDDYNRIDYPQGTVISPSIYGDQILYKQKEGVQYLLGRKYVILRREFWDNNFKNINKEVKNILITLGGTDYNGAVLDKIVSLLEENYDFDITAVDVRKKRIDASEMNHLMCSTDLCISGGGQTTEELACLGVPGIGICFADNQVLNLKGLHDAGSLYSIGRFEEENFSDKLFISINKLMSYSTRLQMSNIGQKLIDGKGALRVAEVVMNTILNQQHANINI